MSDWIIKNRRTLLVFAIIIVVLCPLGVWLSYLCGDKFGGVPTRISADGSLAYLATLISSIATLFIAYIAIKQSDDSLKLSKKLSDLQASEFFPVILVDRFAGLTKHCLESVAKKVETGIVISEIRTDENEVILGYSISLVDDNFNSSLKSFCRTYELGLRYQGKTVAKNFEIKSVQFTGARFSHTFNTNESMDVSLVDQQSLRIFLFILSNSDFMDETTTSNRYIKAGKINLNLKIHSILGKEYEEKISLIKHLVVKPEKTFNMDNVEMLVTASYQVEEK